MSKKVYKIRIIPCHGYDMKKLYPKIYGNFDYSVMSGKLPLVVYFHNKENAKKQVEELKNSGYSTHSKFEVERPKYRILSENFDENKDYYFAD